MSSQFARTTLGLEGLDTSGPGDVDRHHAERQDVTDWAGFHEGAPARQPRGQRMGPCGHCRHGDHQLCAGTGCYRCTGEHRGYGVAAGSDGMAGGSAPEGRLHKEKRRR